MKDLDRAKKSYSTILKCEIADFPMPGTPLKYAMFPFEQAGGVGDVLVEGDGYELASKGSLVYLNAGSNLADVIARVEKAGVKALLSKTSIGEFGFIANFLDSEGNKVALHSRG